MSEAAGTVGSGGVGAPRVDGCRARIDRYELFYSEGRFAYRTSTSARSDEPLREKMHFRLHAACFGLGPLRTYFVHARPAVQVSARCYDGFVRNFEAVRAMRQLSVV